VSGPPTRLRSRGSPAQVPCSKRRPATRGCPGNGNDGGLGEEAATLPAEDPRAGFFGFERRLARQDIEAQSSRLLIALETSRASGAWSAAGSSTVRGLEEQEPCFGANARFGGNHPGGANALFADASVRFVRESMDLQVVRAMATVLGSKRVETVGDQ